MISKGPHVLFLMMQVIDAFEMQFVKNCEDLILYGKQIKCTGKERKEKKRAYQSEVNQFISLVDGERQTKSVSLL